MYNIDYKDLIQMTCFEMWNAKAAVEKGKWKQRRKKGNKGMKGKEAGRKWKKEVKKGRRKWEQNDCSSKERPVCQPGAT